MSRRQNATSMVISLETKTLSEHSGVPEDQLTDALSDLLTEGLAEPYAATMGESAVKGACRITGEGLRELGGHGSSKIVRRRAGTSVLAWAGSSPKSEIGGTTHHHSSVVLDFHGRRARSRAGPG